MLRYILFDVALHGFAICSIYIPMLHYIVYIFLCCCTLKCFVLLGQGHGGDRDAVGNGDRGYVGNEAR